ncbi:MAG: sulfurtransferase TusA family protein [Synechococcaceae cyanobacterium]|nr:sulfurtransferase TusA family protein [Synechococcaceae cyanobacterium]
MSSDSAEESTPRLDLRGTPCPLNVVRSRLALEKLASGAQLELLIDPGEPEEMVQEGLRRDGHRIALRSPASDGMGLSLVVIRDGDRR